MSKWLKEPLLHFLLLGALIFVVYGMLSDQRSEDEIFISAGQQDNLINTFTRTWQRPPTPEEFKGLLDDYVREEIAYREASLMGLEDDDVIVRRRLRQKLELLAEDVASLGVPSDEELQAYLDEHAEVYLIEPRLSLQQIYFSPDRRADPSADAKLLLAELQAPGEPPDISLLGDSIALPGRLDDARLSEIARLFGGIFADELETAASGQWLGPVESGFGQHLVFISEKVSGQRPALEQVRQEVQRDWFGQRRREAVDSLYRRLAENYQIEIETPEVMPGEIAGESAAQGGVQ